MNTEVLTPILDLLDIVGIALFALSGSVIAAKERQTFVTMCFFALVTGTGGGTVRDILIGTPVFWMQDFWYAPVCLSMAAVIWQTPVRLWEGRFFAYADAAGLAAFSVLGSAKAVAYGVPPVPAMLMGVFTGVAGGIIRDAVASRSSLLMEPELYITAATLSAVMTVLGMMAGPYVGIADALIWTLAFSAGFALRIVALHYEISLPSYGRGAPADE